MFAFGVAVVFIVTIGITPSTLAQAQPGADDTITVDLDNVDIYSLIETVSRHTGKNFIIDPRVKATVSIISSQPVNADKLYELFLSVLSLHGYAAVPAGGVTKIVPLANAVQNAVAIVKNPDVSSDNLTTQMFKIKNIPAQQMVEILRPLLPASASFTAVGISNTLVITDSAANISRLARIITELDKPN